MNGLEYGIEYTTRADQKEGNDRRTYRWYDDRKLRDWNFERSGSKGFQNPCKIIRRVTEHHYEENM